jgi:hypothetical protein
MITSTDCLEQLQRLCEQLVAAVSVVDIEKQQARSRLPTLTSEEGATLYEALAAVAHDQGIWLTYTCPPGFERANGMYSHPERLIYVKQQARLHMTKTLAHELAHALDRERTRSSLDEVEIVAEAVAYLVLAWYGLDSHSYSVCYIAIWDDDQAASETLLRCLPRIQRLALAIIDQASAHLAPAAAQPDLWDRALALAQASAPGC